MSFQFIKRCLWHKKRWYCQYCIYFVRLTSYWMDRVHDWSWIHSDLFFIPLTRSRTTGACCGGQACCDLSLRIQPLFTLTIRGKIAHIKIELRNTTALNVAYLWCLCTTITHLTKLQYSAVETWSVKWIC